MVSSPARLSWIRSNCRSCSSVRPKTIKHRRQQSTKAWIMNEFPPSSVCQPEPPISRSPRHKKATRSQGRVNMIPAPLQALQICCCAFSRTILHIRDNMSHCRRHSSRAVTMLSQCLTLARRTSRTTALRLAAKASSGSSFSWGGRFEPFLGPLRSLYMVQTMGMSFCGMTFDKAHPKVPKARAKSTLLSNWSTLFKTTRNLWSNPARDLVKTSKVSPVVPGLSGSKRSKMRSERLAHQRTTSTKL
mmetsp:Transcript_4434/g.10278  ORF Transcript_4434/g.10278 Transcript_4434/m.10278 type:complete len:246 (-) Transcript_4434:847-1584(-)